MNREQGIKNKTMKADGTRDKARKEKGTRKGEQKGQEGIESPPPPPQTVLPNSQLGNRHLYSSAAHCCQD